MWKLKRISMRFTSYKKIIRLILMTSSKSFRCVKFYLGDILSNFYHVKLLEKCMGVDFQIKLTILPKINLAGLWFYHIGGVSTNDWASEKLTG